MNRENKNKIKYSNNKQEDAARESLKRNAHARQDYRGARRSQMICTKGLFRSVPPFFLCNSTTGSLEVAFGFSLSVPPLTTPVKAVVNRAHHSLRQRGVGKTRKGGEKRVMRSAIGAMQQVWFPSNCPCLFLVLSKEHLAFRFPFCSSGLGLSPQRVGAVAEDNHNQS